MERADIQRYTSLLVPPEMIGEHVGASPAHSTHRATTQELRMAMAFFGHMGIEWNLLKEPQEDIDKLAEWVAEFKKHREWFAVDTVVHSDAGRIRQCAWTVWSCLTKRPHLPFHPAHHLADLPGRAGTPARPRP